MPCLPILVVPRLGAFCEPKEQKSELLFKSINAILTKYRYYEGITLSKVAYISSRRRAKLLMFEGME